MRNRLVGALRLALTLGALIAAPALAQDTSSSSSATMAADLESYAGDWLLQQEDTNAPTCAVTFTDQPVAGGWAISVPDACPAPFPAASALAVWSVDDSDGSITIMDANQGVTMKLLSDPDGYYATDEATNPRLYLVAPVDPDGAGGEQDAD
jgi:Protease inhibitor Inh